MRRPFFLMVLVTTLCFGQTTKQSTETGSTAKPSPHAPTIVTPDTIKWADPPPVLAPGAQLAVISGNPAGTGNYVVRLKMPDGYKVMPHWHPTQENVTVLSGEFHVGMGDKFDEAGMRPLAPGSFAAVPPHMHHYAVAKGETIVQVHGTGPFKLVYVNPSDDPSKKK